MNAKQLIKSIRKGNYELITECECDGKYKWTLAKDRARDILACIIDEAVECWNDNCLYVAGNLIAYRTQYALNVSDCAEITLEELWSVLDKFPKLKAELMKKPEITETFFFQKDSLITFLSTLIEKGFLFQIDPEHGYANRYTCIIIAPTGFNKEIPAAAYEVDIDTWAERYLHPVKLGDVDYSIKFRYIH